MVGAKISLSKIDKFKFAKMQTLDNLPMKSGDLDNLAMTHGINVIVSSRVESVVLMSKVKEK